VDFDLTEEQKMLATSTREFLSKEYPPATARQMLADEKGYTPELWRKMVDLGWTGLAFPEKYGGVGGSFLDLAVLLEEMGRACLRGPFFSTVVPGGLTLLELGNENQKSEVLTKVCNGDAIMTMALLEADGRYDAGSVRTTAVKKGEGYVLNGTKVFVENAHVADYIIVPVKTGEAITLFLVETKTGGIKVTQLQTATGSRFCEVILDNVSVAAEAVLGEAGRGEEYIENIMRKAAIAKCAEMIGAGKRVLEITAQYTKDRQQFGKPIGSFQAIQQEFASLVIEIESSAFITYQAAWLLNEGLPCKGEVAIAKSWVSNAYRQAVARGIQIHGTIAFTEDHDLPLYYRHAKDCELAFGDAEYHRHIVAEEYLQPK